MFQLRKSRVIRKPHTGSPKDWGQALCIRDLELKTRYSNTDKRELRLEFTISASGGYTNIRVHVDIEDYTAMLKAMCDVDREAVMAAMSAELAQQLAIAP